MSLTTTNFNIAFSLASDPMEFKFTDTTDYASQSVALADINGKIKVTAPSGVVYDGTLDIDGSVSRINTTTILVPLLSSGTPEIGLYTFDYEATDGVDTVTARKTFSYSYSKPSATSQATVDCLSPELTGSDTTNYLVNAITPVDRLSIVGVDTGNNTISVAGEKVAFVVQGDTFSVINSSGNDGDYTVTGVEYDQVTDTTVITVSSITDATVDGIVVTRKTTLFFPSVLQLPPLVGYEANLSTNSFYSQTHEFLFNTKAYYQYTNGISIVDSFSSSDEIDVDCDVRLCDIFCCINATFNEYLKYKDANNTRLASIELERYILATSHLAALRTAFECGDSTAVDNLVTQIKKVAQCNSDCSCSDGSPAPITGLGGGSTTVVQSSGNGINVSSNSSGNTTTYTLSLSQSILDDIASATATSSVISSDNSLVVSSSTSGGNTEYDVTLPPSTPIVEPKELMAFNVDITDISTGSPVFTVSDVVIQNESNFQSAVTMSDPDVGAPSYYYQRLEVNNFQVSPDSTYKVFIESTYSEDASFSNINSNNPDGLFSRYLTPSVVQKDSGSFYIVLLAIDFYPIQRYMLSRYSNIKLNIKIVE